MRGATITLFSQKVVDKTQHINNLSAMCFSGCVRVVFFFFNTAYLMTFKVIRVFHHSSVSLEILLQPYGQLSKIIYFIIL